MSLNELSNMELNEEEMEKVSGGTGDEFVDVFCPKCHERVASYLKGDEGGRRIAMQYLNEHVETEHR